jgi:two-component system chemotaxis response regulator CheY
MANQKTILIVDDSATVRQMLTLTLTGGGFNVVAAENGAEGLAAAKKQKADLVISDVNMPVMTGLQMIAEIRKLPSYAKTPIFVLTTESGARVAEGKAVGASAWIVKPFKPESLLAGVKRAMG